MRHESAYLRDSIQALMELEAFAASTTEEQFLANPLQQSFAFHRLVIVGESAVRLAKLYQSIYPVVPWGPLISLRNRLVHAYFDLDQQLLWAIVSSRLGELRTQLEEILDAEFGGDEEVGL